MCGIAGWISGTGESPDREVLTRMTRSLAHRGPDAEGFWDLIVDALERLG